MRTRTWVAFCLLLTAAFTIHAETRVALVIGNGAYEHAPLLRNPVQDARAIAAAFRGLGYSVQLVTDAKKPALEAAFQQFAVAATGADHAVVYYSGHGIEVNGVNYLLPVEARIATERTVALEAVPLSTVMDIAAGARRLGLVVLDACRDNPLANSMQRADGTKGLTRGLGRVEPVGRNLLVAYATKDGHVAADGAGTNSPYTTAILEALKQPGLEVRLFWGKVHDRVLSATSRSQEPFTYGALGAEALYLNPPGPSEGSNASSPLPPRPCDSGENERALWQSVEKLGTAKAYEAYLSQCPAGLFSTVAKLQLAGLTRPTGGGESSSASTASPGPLTVFRDCPDCPEMVHIPAGSFLMGSPAKENGRQDDEGPQHLVHLQAFSIGKYAVTFDEWDACMAAGGCKSKPSDQGWGRGRRPVINVSWNDAQEYVRWLSSKTGKTYRLPSEAEWEYAARAGTTTAYYWGDEIGRGHANCDGCSSQWDTKQTAPVGSFASNPWGLHDMQGNVWQWTQDCWHDSYTGAPTDGSAWKSGCGERADRGGSWKFTSSYLRMAYRTKSGAAESSNNQGFRLARD
jgi:formylglycine-generating enzyme required for sulfatase activity